MHAHNALHCTCSSRRPLQIFKAYAVQTLAEGTAFVQDLKLGHYVKLPPRATFSVQLVATTLVGLLQVGVKEWMFSHIPDICQPGQKDFLTCPHNQVLYTTSAIWGLIGPARQFGTESIYHPQLYAIAIGAVLPLPFWLWQRKWPNKYNKYINLPIILNGIGLIPPATGINYSSWFLLGFIFQFVIRRRNFVWWSKFNYVLTAAFDCGTVLSVLFIFFTLQFPKGGINLNWWGNTVYENSELPLVLSYAASRVLMSVLRSCGFQEVSIKGRAGGWHPMVAGRAPLRPFVRLSFRQSYGTFV